jgi:hypothetical protein
MAKDLKRVQLDDDTDLVHVVEQVYGDRTPRLIQRGDQLLAVIVSPDDFAESRAAPKSRVHRDRLMALAGVWSDLDADEMIAAIYEGRNSPPSRPLDA